MHQITVRDYPLLKVPRRLRVSTRSLYMWLMFFAELVPKSVVDYEAENWRLKRELAQVTEERKILNEVTDYFARGSQ